MYDDELKQLIIELADGRQIRSGVLDEHDPRPRLGGDYLKLVASDGEEIMHVELAEVPGTELDAFLRICAHVPLADGRRRLSAAEKVSLICDLGGVFHASTESYEYDDRIGPCLAYLYQAIAYDEPESDCDWPATEPIMPLLRQHFPEGHRVWQFVHEEAVDGA